LSTKKGGRNYIDETLEIKGRKLVTYERGRDIGAWMELLVDKPLNLSWQDRSLLDKVSTLIRGTKVGIISLWTNDSNALALLRYIALSFPLQGPNKVDLSLPSAYSPVAATNDLQLDLDRHLKENIRIISSADLGGYKAVVPSTLTVFILNGQDTAGMIGAFTQIVRCTPCVIFIKDFSFYETKWPHDIVRSNGLSICETADGYGECWRIS
jgi:hypothetical protein